MVCFRSQKQDHHLYPRVRLEFFAEVIGIGNYYRALRFIIHSRFVPRESRTKMDFFPQFKSEKFYTTETPATNADATDDGLSTYSGLDF